MVSYATAPFYAAASFAQTLLRLEDYKWRLKAPVLAAYSVQDAALSSLMAGVNAVAAILSIPHYYTTEYLCPPSNRDTFIGSHYLIDAKTCCQNLNEAIAYVFAYTLMTLNPRVLGNYSYSIETHSRTDSPLPEQSFYIHPNKLADPYQGMAADQTDLTNTLRTGNWVDRHIKTRIAAPVMAVAFSVKAVARIGLGAVAAAFAILTLGLSKEINTFAFKNLSGVGFIFNQLLNGFIGIFRTDLMTIDEPVTEASAPKIESLWRARHALLAGLTLYNTAVVAAVAIANGVAALVDAPLHNGSAARK